MRNELKYSNNEFEEIYNQVVDLVKEGESISSALDIANITSATFYRRISQKQKTLLQESKTANTIYGVGSNYYNYRKK